MKRISLFAKILLISIFWVSSVYGGTFQGMVSDLQVSGNAVYFKIVGAEYAECASNQRYILNGSTPYGRNLYLLIQQAFSAGKEITVVSLGTCSLAPKDAEDIINIATSLNDREKK